MSRADAAARELVTRFGLTDIPVDPEEVAHKLDADVIRQPFPHELSGMLLRRDGRFVIGLNAGHEPARQRFALAHVVGHLQMHRGRDLLLDTAARYSHGSMPSMPTDREEAEANRFAAALLAPDTTVRRAAVEADFRTGAQLVDLLAPRFGLTAAAMGYRLISLGVIVDC